jgi:hypothetical protein
LRDLLQGLGVEEQQAVAFEERPAVRAPHALEKVGALRDFREQARCRVFGQVRRLAVDHHHEQTRILRERRVDPLHLLLPRQRRRNHVRGVGIHLQRMRRIECGRHGQRETEGDHQPGMGDGPGHRSFDDTLEHAGFRLPDRAKG